MNIRRWQDWAILGLGLWLLVSPWVLQFTRELGWGSIDFYVVGLGIAALAVLALRLGALWGEWVAFVLGLWMIGSPWLLGFASGGPAVPDAVAAGTLIAVFAVWVILRYTPRPGAAAAER